jgi:sulfatase modifying factor 1
VRRARLQRGRWGAWAALSTMAVGCATVLGIDKDYHPVGEGAVGALDWPCPQAGALACAGNAQKSKLICGSNGRWATNGTCDGNTLCDTTEGVEQGTCKDVVAACEGKSPAEVACEGDKRVKCGPDLVTREDAEACPVNTDLCLAGACVALPRSCAGLSATCGPEGDESCCAIRAVPGGTYDRSNDAMYPATVSDFRLDRFEITVGRFRAFVDAYPASKPAAGAGAHPLIAGSGWDTAWDVMLPADKAALVSSIKCSPNYPTWTDAAGANEDLPMNCLRWYDAFAFCAWDGGRLPTEAEWNYAAAGGREQRDYPWGSAPPHATHTVYDCTGDGAAGCALTDILRVGSKPAGDGKWGQADLSGGVWEWNLDAYAAPYPLASCDNCGSLQSASSRAVRGGGWSYDASTLLSSLRCDLDPTSRTYGIGARCARTP